MASCLVITAIICVLVTTVATIVSFATPNWLAIPSTTGALLSGSLNTRELCKCMSCDCGLWINCQGGFASTASLENCRWFFSNNFEIEKGLPDWFKAVQGLMACAVASSLLSLLIGLGSLCCSCKGCNPNQAAGAFINLTFLLLAVAICVFGAKAHIEYKAVIIGEQGHKTPIFGWSFWTGVGATGISLISSVLYFCTGRTDDH